MGALLDTMRVALTDWRAMLRAEPAAARRGLSALLAGRLLFTPAESGEPVHRFEGPGTIQPVMAGAVRLQQVMWLQRDSNPCLSRDHVFARHAADFRGV
jgi:hypothetical protein